MTPEEFKSEVAAGVEMYLKGEITNEELSLKIYSLTESLEASGRTEKPEGA